MYILYLVICGVDQDLVEDLEQARGVGNLLELHLLARVHPERRGLFLRASDVGVGAEQNVLELRLFLVGLLNGFLVSGGAVGCVGEAGGAGGARFPGGGLSFNKRRGC